jgi:LuxR family transcriptional regulator, maltose regulon positive regulatory protein
MTQTDSQAPLNDSLSAGFQALADAAWATGFAYFQAAVQDTESAEAHEGLAMAAWWLDDVPVVFASRERAYRLYRQRDDRLGAARCAIWIALDHYIYRGELAITNGWLQRAHRLLDGVTPAAEHGWLAIWSGHIALFDRHDVATAQRVSAETLALAQSLNLADLEALSLALEGLAMVSAGHVSEGMRRLDESTTAALSGDVSDFDAIATICCYLIFACERVRDYDRAAQWCEKVEAFSRRCNYRSMFPICRTHYAAVLIWRGDWHQAEAELIEATRQLTASRQGWAPDSVVRLGELRRRQGRHDEAAQLFEQSSTDARSMLGLAELALERGDPATAGDLVERFLRRVQPDDRTERAEGLTLAIRVQLRLGGFDRARERLMELETTAALVGTEPLRALLNLSRGRLAAAVNDTDGARRALEDAVDGFQQSSAPYETALARLDLARVLAAEERREAAASEAGAALDAFRQLGAQSAARQAADLLRELGAAVAEDSSDTAGLTRRERDVLRLLASGSSNQQIADGLFISIRTVERHISTIYEKLGATGSAARALATAYAITHGIANPQMP